jgi:hypothetical protein
VPTGKNRDGGLMEAGPEGAGDASSDAAADAAPVLVCATLYVDAVHGSDANVGTSAAPFKSITTSFARVTSCTTTIRVAPGTYDTANGETFPLAIPAGIALIGDETNKGLAAGAEVVIAGMSAGSSTTQASAVAPGPNTTFAGFAVQAIGAPANSNGIFAAFSSGSVTIRNNTLTAISSDEATGLYTDTENSVVTGNVATGWRTAYYPLGTGSFQFNVARNNTLGIVVGGGGAFDLGGGSLDSPGQNTFACNAAGMEVFGGGIVAENNAWDHVPPVMVQGGSMTSDIVLVGSSPAPDIAGATLASPDCP